MASKATENLVRLINDLCGCDAVSVGEDNIYVDDMSDDGGYFIECEDDDEVYNTLMSMHDGMTLLNSVRNKAEQKTEVWTEYSESADMTFIMEGSNDGKTAAMSVVGFYYGKPNDKDTEYFRGKTTAICEL